MENPTVSQICSQLREQTRRGESGGGGEEERGETWRTFAETYWLCEGVLTAAQWEQQTPPRCGW